MACVLEFCRIWWTNTHKRTYAKNMIFINGCLDGFPKCSDEFVRGGELMGNGGEYLQSVVNLSGMLQVRTKSEKHYKDYFLNRFLAKTLRVIKIAMKGVLKNPSFEVDTNLKIPSTYV